MPEHDAAVDGAAAARIAFALSCETRGAPPQMLPRRPEPPPG